MNTSTGRRRKSTKWSRPWAGCGRRKTVRKVLAKTAVDESGIGVYEDKLAKIKTKTLGTLWDQRGVKTCDLVEEDKARGIRKYAKPIGVIADVVPCTNPESTICCIGLSTLKTRNAMIVLAPPPHPEELLPDGGVRPRGAEEDRRAGGPAAVHQEHEPGKDPGADGQLRLCRGDRRRRPGQGRLRGRQAGPDRGRRQRRLHRGCDGA